MGNPLDWLRKCLTAAIVLAIVGAFAAPALAGSPLPAAAPGLAIGTVAEPVAMSMMPGLADSDLVVPASNHCQWRQYCNYGQCYQRQICYVCWYDYGVQKCAWRWQ